MTPRPSEDDAVHRIAKQAQNPTDPKRWAESRAWRAGLRLYREGYFWEAHEVWEPVWMNARLNSPERFLVQGVIQIANAALKQSMGRAGAARRLASIGASLIAEAGPQRHPHLMGLHLPALEKEIARYLRELRESSHAAPPVIEVAPEGGAE